MPNNAEFIIPSPEETSAASEWDILTEAQPASELTNDSLVSEDLELADESPEKEPPFYINDPHLQEYSIEQYNTKQEIARLTIAAQDNRDHISPTLQRNYQQALAAAESRDKRLAGQINLRIAEVKKLGPEAYEQSLLEEERARRREEAEKNKKLDAAKIISFNSVELRDLDRQFQRNFARHQEEGTKLSKEEFEKWEDEYAFYWQPIAEQVSRANLNIYEQADAMADIVPFPTDTVESQSIEAQAGEYFFERKNALLRAIRESDHPSKEQDEQTLLDFWHTVRSHIDYKYMKDYEMKAIGEKAYEKNRTKHHNAVVTHLNEINRLAVRYGTRPFTARGEFWTSGVRKELQTPPMQTKMRYDRDVASKFYQIAFKEDIRVREKELEQELKALNGKLYNED